MYPALVEKVVAKLRQEHPEVICFEGPSLSGEGLFYVILRPMSLVEFGYYSQSMARSPEYAKEFICRVCILEVFDSKKNRFVPLRELPLGLYEDASEIIVENSEFTPEGIKSLLNQHRHARGETAVQAVAFICRAFPALKPQEIEQMSASSIARHITMAEVIYEAQGEEDPFFQVYTEEDVVTEEQENADVLRDIARQARENDKIMGAS